MSVGERYRPLDEDLSFFEKVENLLATETGRELRELAETLGQRAACSESPYDSLKLFLTGGALRDAHLGNSIRDWDLKLFGIHPDAFRDGLSERLGFHNDPRSPLRFTREPFEIYIPLRESPGPKWSKGFDPTMTLEDSLHQTDFTVNALALDPTVPAIIDPLGGQKDLNEGLLRACNLELFGNDPLRVVRAALLSQRLHLSIEDNTLEVIRKACSNEPLRLPASQRMASEISKTKHAFDLFQKLQEFGFLSRAFPEYRGQSFNDWEELSQIVSEGSPAPDEVSWRLFQKLGLNTKDSAPQAYIALLPEEELSHSLKEIRRQLRPFVGKEMRWSSDGHLSLRFLHQCRLSESHFWRDYFTRKQPELSKLRWDPLRRLPDQTTFCFKSSSHPLRDLQEEVWERASELGHHLEYRTPFAHLTLGFARTQEASNLLQRQARNIPAPNGGFSEIGFRIKTPAGWKECWRLRLA